jgi:hypothetical protein
MTQTVMTFMGSESHGTEPRERLAAYLRQHFQREGFAAKRLSKAIRCTPKAAENILDAHWPNSRTWQKIVQQFGRDVLDATFGPDIDETVARLKREEAHLEQQLAEKRARRRQAEGVDLGDIECLEATSPSRAAVEPRTFGGAE